MEKNWFIFKGDHHLGPFSSEDLVRMLQHDKAKPDDLIWKEGEADWLPLRKHPALAGYFEKPAPVKPKVTIKAPVDDFVLKEKKEVVIEDPENEAPPPLPPLPEEPAAVVGPTADEGPPPLPPLPVTESEDEYEIVVDLEEELEDVSEPRILQEEPGPEVEEKLIFDDFNLDHDEEEDDDATRDDITVPQGIWEEAPTWQKTTMIGSLLLGILMSLHFFNWQGADPADTRFSGIARAKKRDLIKVVNTNPKVGVKASLALSNTGNEIWLATNIRGEAQVYLNMKSIEGRVLSTSTETIEVRSSGELIAGGAKFRELELVKGTSIADGEYEAMLVGYKTGLKSRLAGYLSNYSFFKDFKLVKNHRPEFKLSVPVLFSIKPKPEFEKLLEENKKKKKEDLTKPFQELVQRHKTFSGLLSNIKEIYKSSLGKMNRGRDVKIFERQYAMEIEPILRDLLLDSNRRHISLINKNKKRSDDYLKLVEEGKEIGILVSDIVTRTRKYGKLTKKKRAKLVGIFAPRIEEILKVSKEDQLRLESEMKSILSN